MNTRWSFLQVAATVLCIALGTAPVARADEFDPPAALAGRFDGTVTGKVNWVHNSNTWFMFWVETITTSDPASKATDFEPFVRLPQGLKINVSWDGSVQPAQPDAAMVKFISGLKPGQRFTLKLTPNFEKTGVRLAEVPAGAGAPTAPTGAAPTGAQAKAEPAAGPNLILQNPDDLGEFTLPLKGQGPAAGATWPTNFWAWAVGCWDADSSGELANVTVDDRKAFRLSNVGPHAALQLFNKPVKLPAGPSVIRFAYRTQGDGRPLVKLSITGVGADGVQINAPAWTSKPGSADATVSPAASQEAFSTVEARVDLKSAGEATLNFQDTSLGEKNGVLIRDVEMTAEAPRVIGEPGARIDESKVTVRLRVDPTAATDATTFPTLGAAVREATAHLNRGEGVQINVAAGTYRETLGEVSLGGAARDALLVIAGAGADKTIFTGADAYAADRWQDLGDGLYCTDWAAEWGNWAEPWKTPLPLGHRSEMVIVDGWPLRQLLIEQYDYSRTGQALDHGNRKQSWRYTGFADPKKTLKPGTFGVAERPENGHKLYIRLPDGKKPADVKIEVATRRQFARIDGGSPDLGKNGLVLRDFTVTHYASRTKNNNGENTISLPGTPTDLLIERCRFVWNNACGLALGADRATIRDSDFSYNGFSGIGGAGSNLLLERNNTNFNNWRGTWGAQRGWWVGGVKLQSGVNQVVRGHTSFGNLAAGMWFDVQCEHVQIDDLVSARNAGTGLVIELSDGPFTIRRLLSADNAPSAFAASIVGSYTMSDSILYGDYAGTFHVKDKDVPCPLVQTQWYQRDDEHAKRKQLAPGLHRIERSVLVTGPRQPMTLVENLGLPRDVPRYTAYHPDGADNLFFQAGGGTPMFYYVNAQWQPTEVDLAAWSAVRVEPNAVIADPDFMDAAHLDFRLSTASPLRSHAAALPAKRAATAEQILEDERFKAWAEEDAPKPQE